LWSTQFELGSMLIMHCTHDERRFAFCSHAVEGAEVAEIIHFETTSFVLCEPCSREASAGKDWDQLQQRMEWTRLCIDCAETQGLFDDED